MFACLAGRASSRAGLSGASFVSSWVPSSPADSSASHGNDRLRSKNSLKTFFNESGVLDVGEPGVEAVQFQKLFVCALLNDLPLTKNKDLVRAANGAQPMGNHEAGPVGHE